MGVSTTAQLGVPPNGWFQIENPTEMDDLELPLFQETSIYASFSIRPDLVEPAPEWLLLPTEFPA